MYVTTTRNESTGVKYYGPFGGLGFPFGVLMREKGASGFFYEAGGDKWDGN
jgi:hypothetical protein